MQQVVGVGFLAFALQVFFAALDVDDELHDVVARLDGERIGAGFDARDGGGLRKRPARAVGVHAGDGLDALERVAAVGAVDGGDGATVVDSGHKLSAPRG